jgi:hypothetical protein
MTFSLWAYAFPNIRKEKTSKKVNLFMVWLFDGLAYKDKNLYHDLSCPKKDYPRKFRKETE